MKHLTLFFALALSGQLLFAQTLRTNSGAIVGDNQNSKTIGNNGQVLMEDVHLIEKLAAFDRERIPERVVHARGAGAYGEFVAASDFSEVTKQRSFLEKGKQPLYLYGSLRWYTSPAHQKHTGIHVDLPLSSIPKKGTMT